MRIAPLQARQTHHLEQRSTRLAAPLAPGQAEADVRPPRSGAGTGSPPEARSRCGAAPGGMCGRRRRPARRRAARAAGRRVRSRRAPAAGSSCRCPDGPRMEVNEPAGDRQVEPGEHGLAPVGLVEAGQLETASRHQPRCTACRPAAGQPVEVPAEHVARHGGDGDDHQGERRRLAVGEVLLVGPELRGERLRRRSGSGSGWR